MKTACCCHTPSRDPALAPSLRHRILRIAGWLVPGVILAALPKCPVCVAAYVALFTGCGISIAAAGAARWFLIATCVTTLSCLMLSTAYKRFWVARP